MSGLELCKLTLEKLKFIFITLKLDTNFLLVLSFMYLFIFALSYVR